MFEKFPYYLKNLVTGYVMRPCEMMTAEEASRANERIKKYVSDHLVWTMNPDAEELIEKDRDYLPLNLP